MHACVHSPTHIDRAYALSVHRVEDVFTHIRKNKREHIIVACSKALHMAVNLSNVEEAIISELMLSQDEARVFLAIVKGSKMDSAKISATLGWNDNQRALLAAKSLVNRGMVIEITKTEFEALHPRFAITNRYRRRCEEDGIPFKKNLKVDNIGIILERPYDDARTK